VKGAIELAKGIKVNNTLGELRLGKRKA